MKKQGTLRTIWAIACHEVGRSMRDTRFLGAFAICLVLAAGSVAINMQSYVKKKRDYDASSNAYARMIAEKVKFVIHLTTTPKPIARKPVATQFIALAGEQDPDTRAVAKVEYNTWFHGDLHKNPLPALFFPVDLVFVFGIVMTLFAFALTYDALSGEAHQSAMRLLLAGPVSRGTYILGKLLGAMLSLSIPYAISAGAIIGMLFYYGQEVSILPSDIGATAVFLCLGLMYTCAVASLSVMVSSFFRSAGATMICLLLVWLFGFVAVPYSSASIAHIIVDPPGVTSLEHRLLYLGYAPYNDSYERLAKRASQRLSLSGPFPEEVVYLVGESDSVQAHHPLKEATQAYISELWKDALTMVESISEECAKYTRSQKKIESLAQWFRRISPYGCFLNASVALANTGFAREMQLRESSQQYLRECTELCGKVGGTNRPIDSALFPRPLLHEVPVAARIHAGLFDIIALAGFTILFFLVAYWNFIRREIG
jgi:ABC-type transport system involved in multi-copper enzyme maturation permease subunit